MLETSARLLRLLSLLQAKAFWRGEDLADRLGVTPRTLRRDVSRLRSLDYPIDADAGPHGGYRLGPGGSLPPLLLDDEEAVAVAVGLRTAAGGTVVGLEEAAVAALRKLEQVLPARLHHHVAALSASTVALGSSPPRIDPTALMTIAHACSGLERLRFTYRDRDERVTERTVEPYRLVHTAHRWYLVARDVRADGWRTFRVDRIEDPVGTGHRFRLDDPPDASALVSRGMAVAPYRYSARVRVDATPEQAASIVPRTVAVIERAADGTSILTLGGDTLDWLAGFLAGLPLPFEVVEPPALRDRLRALGERLSAAHPANATGAATGGDNRARAST